VTVRSSARRLWGWARRADAPKTAGGPARPVPVTDTDVSVLTAAEYPGLPPTEPGPGMAEIRQHVELLGAGVDAGTATALDQLVLARERGWLADLDSERAAHQSWVDAIAAEARAAEARLGAELEDVRTEIGFLDGVMAAAVDRLGGPQRADRKPR
jgi:hypothetical protein